MLSINVVIKGKKYRKLYFSLTFVSHRAQDWEVADKVQIKECTGQKCSRIDTLTLEKWTAS